MGAVGYHSPFLYQLLSLLSLSPVSLALTISDYPLTRNSPNLHLIKRSTPALNQNSNSSQNSGMLTLSPESKNIGYDLTTVGIEPETWDAGHNGSNLVYSVCLGLVLFVISLVTLAGNVITILAVKTVHSLRVSKTNYLIVSLACADLMVGLVVAPIAGVVHILQGRWVFGYWMCHVWHAFDVLASTASILNLTAISLDRYIAIRKSLDYSTIVTHASCIAAITLVWLLSTVISFPAIVVWHFSLTSSEDSDVSYDARVCEFTNNRVYRITSSLISFYLPLCLMTFAYISVYMKAQQQLRVLASGNLLIKSNSGGASKSDGRGNSGKSGNKTSATVESSSENVTALRVHRGGGGANAKWNTFDTNGNLSAFSGASRHSYKSTNNPRGTPTASSMRSPTRTHQGITRSPSAHCRPSSGVMTYSKGGCSYVGVPMVTTTDVGGKTSCRLGAFLRERKATKTLGIVFGVFILCWLPFFTFNVVQAFTNRSFQYEIQLFDFFTLLGYANSCLNPFIYAATNVRFRLAFMRIIGCKRHRGDRDFAGLTTLGGTNHH